MTLNEYIKQLSAELKYLKKEFKCAVRHAQFISVLEDGTNVGRLEGYHQQEQMRDRDEWNSAWNYVDLIGVTQYHKTKLLKEKMALLEHNKATINKDVHYYINEMKYKLIKCYDLIMMFNCKLLDNYRYSEKHDKRVRYFLKNYDDYDIDCFDIVLHEGSKSITLCIRNYPYAYGREDTGSVLPKFKTRKKLKKLVEKIEERNE